MKLLISKYLTRLYIKTVYCYCRVNTSDQLSQNNLFEQEEEKILKLASQMFYGYRIKIFKIANSIDVGNIKIILESCKLNDILLVYRVNIQRISIIFIYEEIIKILRCLFYY